jgi:hypothetical protein
MGVIPAAIGLTLGLIEADPSLRGAPAFAGRDEAIQGACTNTGAPALDCRAAKRRLAMTTVNVTVGWYQSLTAFRIPRFSRHGMRDDKRAF